MTALALVESCVPSMSKVNNAAVLFIFMFCLVNKKKNNVIDHPEAIHVTFVFAPLSTKKLLLRPYKYRQLDSPTCCPTTCATVVSLLHLILQNSHRLTGSQ